MYSKDEILKAMETCLDDHEKVIFKARHGVELDPATLEQLYSNFNISRDVLISIEGKVLRYLRQNKNPHN
ncbi:hypothetical protein [Desulfosporosinus nitroreducens]|uniref:hypothetical protein n=1 Tax=Desulfosporosinus nitroreducens TaxID=2018668 RepID=UPI00207D2F1A|nr:hypothetical protein [Desulfosporosinus nitroreducens]MCO1604305.1 hypothetical protein [Desulfosporosinus nitroreducens]